VKLKRASAPVIVSRPGEAGRQLAAGLRDRDFDALWWPAFDVGPPDDPQPLRAALERLAEFDWVIFVSPAAARGCAAALDSPWPRGTGIAAVGRATLEAVRAAMPGADAARTLAPAGAAAEAQAGSEALWAALSESVPPPRRVLIVRAASGREWLAERLRESGAEVEQIAAYRRAPHEPTHAERAALAALVSGGAPATLLVSSTEAVEVLDRQFELVIDAPQWVRHGAVLCTHPRIEEKLRAHGYRNAGVCEPDPAAIAAALVRLRIGARLPPHGGDYNAADSR
jgi:uroporphyrinogen-III synthase